MNSKFLCDKKLGVKLCMFMLGLAAFISCQSKAERDKQLFANDPAAVSDLQRLNADLNNTGQITPDNFERLKELRSKYPDLSEIAKSYRAALIYREDWETLERSLRDIPSADLSRDDKILLAKIYIKLGRFAESSEILERCVTEAPSDVEFRSFSALAYFNQGHLAEAAADLDAVWDAIISQKRIDDINLRGMIFFQKRDYEKAIVTLQKSIEIESHNTAATNMLSRVYAAAGDVERAESFRAETEKAQDESTREESRKMRFVSFGRKLETAWNDKRYDDVLLIANEMVVISDEKNREAILKYIAGAEAELKKKNQR